MSSEESHIRGSTNKLSNDEHSASSTSQDYFETTGQRRTDDCLLGVRQKNPKERKRETKTARKTKLKHTENEIRM